MMTTPTLELTLCIPDFLRAELALAQELPLLQRLLSRSDRMEARTEGHERALFELFSIALPPQQELPVAALTYALEHGASADGILLRADPVYCRADQHKVVMLANDLDLAHDEAQQMIAELNRLFAEDGWEFSAPTPQHWYLRLPQAMELATTPVSQALGKDIRTLLPRSAQGAILHRALTEMEMLLHASPTNQQRRVAGKLPVTNLWLWGGGALPHVPKTEWAQVWSDDVLVLALAKFTQVPRCAAPGSAGQWLEQAVTTGKHLIVLAPTQDAAHTEREWFATLAAALKSGRLNALTLRLNNHHRYHITRGMLRRWWRRDRPLRSFV
ncbi:MAG: hypothetical protein AB1810_11545 [Pseudomonadota bacterium]